jgi:energy-coupling factor transporter ATP-binding protein EcfA2
MKPDGLPARWTIILGENGTGKTTLLECIACSFPITTGQRRIDEETNEPLDNVELQPLGGEWDGYFRSASSNFKIRATLHNAELRKRQRKRTSLTLERNTFENFSAFKIDQFINDKEKKLRGATLFVTSGTPVTVTVKKLVSDTAMKSPYFSLIAAYGANRTATSRDAVSLSEAEIAGPMATMFSPDAKLRNAEEWLLQVDYASRLSSRPSKNPLLNHVKDALLRMLPEVTDIVITSNKDGELPGVQFKTRFGALSLRELSLGYLRQPARAKRLR